MNGAGHDDLSTEMEVAAPDVTPDDDVELSEEIYDTTTIEQLLDGIIEEVNDMVSEAVDVSLEGNPVKTHIELVNFSNEIIQMLFDLKTELVVRVANRAEEISEQGAELDVVPVNGAGILRKQVIEES